jgi:acyl-CoA reductase-like NAD-dependent aldehyde dehydrogenase
METERMLIGQEWLPAAEGGDLDNINPANGELLCRIARGGARDVDRAVAAASESYRGAWSKLAASERALLLNAMADIIADRADALALLDTQDMGKPLTQTTTGDVVGAQGFLRYFAGLADKIEGVTYSTPAGVFGYSTREPYGVVGCIVPFNYPLTLACIKIAPALAAGNTVILKPASVSPRSALALGAIGLDAGLPPGTLNVVTGLGEEAGAAMAAHNGIGKITFTGSTTAGVRLVTASAGNFKKLTLELGGKTANIILPDADLDMAIPAAARTIFLNSGQICTAGSRLLVHRDMKEQILGPLVEIAEKLKVGDPMAADTKLGPLVSEEQWQRVAGYIQGGIDEGATLLTGGGKPDDPALADGYYMAPTIFDDVMPDMKICRQEVFGPVLCVQSYETEAEAIELANGTGYGLAADLWTRDVNKAHKLAAQLAAGIIWVNCTNVVGPWMSYGGYRASGLGFEGGIASMHELTRPKSVIMDVSEQPNTWALDD